MIDIESLLSPYGPASSYAVGGTPVETHDIALLEPLATPAGAPAIIDAVVVDVTPASGKHRAEVPIDSKMVETVPIQIGRLSA